MKFFADKTSAPPASVSPPTAKAAGSLASPLPVEDDAPKVPQYRDVTKQVRREAKGKLHAWTTDRIARGEEPTDDEIRTERKRIYDEINSRNQAEYEATGVVFENKDRVGSAAAILEQAPETGTSGNVLQNIFTGMPSMGRALWHGHQGVITTDEGLEESGDVGILGKVDWFGRMLTGIVGGARVQTGMALGEDDPLYEALRSPVVSNIRASQAFGREAHIDQLMQGRDEFDALMDADSTGWVREVLGAPLQGPAMVLRAGKEMGAVPEWVPDPIRNDVNKLVTVIGMSMLDPDVFMVGGPFLGAVRGIPQVARGIDKAMAGISTSAAGKAVAKTLNIPTLGRVMDKKRDMDKKVEQVGRMMDEAVEAVEAAADTEKPLDLTAEIQRRARTLFKEMGEADPALPHIVKLAVASRMAKGSLTEGVTSRFVRARTEMLSSRKAIEDSLTKLAENLSTKGRRKAEWSKRAITWLEKSLELSEAQTALRMVQKVPKALGHLGDPKAFEEHVARFRELNDKIHEATGGLARLGANEELAKASRDQIIEWAKERAELVQQVPDVLLSAELDTLTKRVETLQAEVAAAEKAMPDRIPHKSYKKFEKDMRTFQRRILNGKLQDQWADEEFAQAFKYGVQDVADSYDQLVKHYGKLDPSINAEYALQAEAISWGMYERGWRGLLAELGYIKDPIRQRWMATSEEAKEAFVAARATVRAGQHDLVGLREEAMAFAKASGRPAKEHADIAADKFIELVNDWSTNPESKWYVRGAFVDGQNQAMLSNWDAAKRILRASVARYRKNGREGGQQGQVDFKAFEALARAWLPKGLDLKNSTIPHRLVQDLRSAIADGIDLPGSPRPAKGKKKKKDVSPDELTLEQLMDHMKRRTAAYLSPDAEKGIAQGTPARGELRAVELEPERMKAWTIAQQAVLGSMTEYRLSADIQRKFFQAQNPKAVAAAEAIWDGNFMAAGGNVGDGLRLLNALGVNMLHRKRKGFFQPEIAAGLDALNDPISGENFLRYRLVAEDLENEVGRIVKDLDPYTPKAVDSTVKWADSLLRTGARLYSVAVLTGLILPRASYFITNYFQDMSNILTQQGGRSSFGAFREMGGLKGGILHPWFDRNFEGKAGRFFASVLDSDVAKLHEPTKHKAGEKFAGTEYTYGDVREAWVRGGVVSGAVGGMNMKSAIRARGAHTALERVLSKLGQPAEAWMDIADAMDMRRRTGLYVHLIKNEDFTPEAAARQVRETLFDWNAPDSAIEEMLLKRFVLFWGFQRRALEFGFKTIASGFTGRHVGESMKDYLFRVADTPAARTYGVMKAQDAVRGYYNAQADDEEDAVFRSMNPLWARWNARKFWINNLPMDPDHIDHAWEENGRKASYEALGIPNFTAVDSIQTLGLIIGGMVGLATEGDGRDLWPVLADLLGPALGEKGLEFFDLYESPDFKDAKGQKLYSPTDRKVAQVLGLSYRHESDDKPIWRIRPGKEMEYHLLDRVILHNMSQYLDPIIDAKSGRWEANEFHRALLAIAGKWTGLWQTYQHRPEKTVEYADRDAATRATISESIRKMNEDT